MSIIIKVLGAQCSKCKKLERITNEVVKDHGFDASVEKIEDFSLIMSYGFLYIPALVMNEKVIFNGRIPSKTEIKEAIDNIIYELKS